MITHISEPSPQAYARGAGLLYLISGAFTGVSLQYFLSVSRDIAAGKDILAAEPLIHLGVVSDLIGQVGYIIVALMLFRIFRSVNPFMGALIGVFWIVEVPIDLLNNLNLFAIVFLAHSPVGITTDQAHTLTTLFAQLHSYGLSLAAIFFGLWLLPMGYLVITSRFLPQIIGVLLIIAGVGYVAQSMVDILTPNSGVNIYLFTSWGELIFALWLLIRGVNDAQWEKLAHNATTYSVSPR
jgi:hypothetical protein